MRRLHFVWMALACTSLACGPDVSGSGSEGEESWEDGRTLVDTYIPEQGLRVDLIVVVDDSPSMRAHLPTMAANVGAFADLITSADAPDMRVAITTTSVDGPTCAGERALGGTPLVDSCRQHLEDFTGPDEHGENGGGELDHTALCESQCSLDSIERVQSSGSTLAGGLAVRPWFDSPRGLGGSNLAEGVDYSEALSCSLLQGFGGCGFESPIEAAARMVERYADPSDTMFGFRRPNAVLMMLMISDEDDCSHLDASGTMFSPEGARVFWPEGADEPLSAICVNASLDCEGEGCELVAHDLSGAPTSDPSAAALLPVTRLTDAFEAAGEYQQAYAPLLSVVGGFGPQGELYYEQPEPGSEHEAYAAAYGIGPSCVAPSPINGELLRAAPGGRLDSLTQLLSPGNNYSICDTDWSPSLEPVFQTVWPGVQPWCMPGEAEWACIADLDADAGVPAPDCVLEQVGGEAREQLSLCQRDAEGNWLFDADSYDYVPPAGEDVCWVYRTDTQALSESEYDDAPVECIDQEARGDIGIVRTIDNPVYDAHYALRCRPC